MCGIATIFSYRDGPPVDESELLRIREQMVSRGPDGAGLWLSETRRVGMAHRRLAILDLSDSGAQPMFDEKNSFGIVFNGEIYNYLELRDELERKGFRFKSTTDTEVLLHLYAERGVAMLDCLRGMYAFAIWDERQKALFLARDPYGIKPLYYADDGHTIRAASQVKALLAGGRIKTDCSPAGHVGLFLFGNVPDPHTLYRAVHAMPAGTYLWIAQGKSKRAGSFCQIPRMFGAAQRNTHATCDLQGALRESVRKHLVADVPVGVFLSSGIDSTAIAALAAEEGGTLNTVTLGFDEYRGTPNDEVPLAEEFARSYQTKHQTIWVSRRDFEDRLPEFFSAMDQPTIDGVNTYFVSLAAERAGLKVALSGIGGDELFGGYPSFQQVPSLVKAVRPFKRLKQIARVSRVVTAPLVKSFTSPKYSGLLEYGGTWGGAYLLRRGMFMPWELPEILDADLVREGWRDLQPIAKMEQEVRHITSSHSKLACLESCWYMRNQLLRDADWAGMAHSLEIRVPLVDTELLSAAAMWIANGNSLNKKMLFEASSRPLSSRVHSRPKTGFLVPLREWLSAGLGDRDLATGTDQPWERGLRTWARVVYGQFAAN